MTKLLPCPFCGGKPHVCHTEPNVISKYQEIDDDGSRFFVECRYPGCMTRTLMCETKADAAERWNRRVRQPETSK